MIKVYIYEIYDFPNDWNFRTTDPDFQNSDTPQQIPVLNIG